MKLIVVATDEEYNLAKKRFKHHLIIKTGVGGINVVNKLKNIPKWIKIINFGYAGSNNIPIGTEIKVGFCLHYHKTKYNERAFVVGKPEDKIWCYTSDEFIEEYKLTDPVVFDMELAYILALGFKRVESIKIISDNLSLERYEEKINDRKSKANASR